MEVMQLFNNLWTRMLLYAFLVGGVPMIIEGIDEFIKERKAKKRRQTRKNREGSSNEETSEYDSAAASHGGGTFH